MVVGVIYNFDLIGESLSTDREGEEIIQLLQHSYIIPQSGYLHNIGDHQVIAGVA